MNFAYLEYCVFILGIRRCVLPVTQVLATFKINLRSMQWICLLKFVQKKIRAK